ncbi:cobalamin biosynthesis protein, partial [Streptomyces sp. NPDC005918]
NAGPVEAAFAGALGVRLGGTLSYGGRIEHRPVLNGEGREVRVADIDRAAELSRRVGLLALGTVVGARWALRSAMSLRSAISLRSARSGRGKA